MIPGGLVWIFDDVDIALPSGLERMLETLAQNPELGFVYGQHDIFEVLPTNKTEIVPVAEPRVESDELFQRLLERCFIWQGEMLVRRNCYSIVGPFDERLIRSQDYDMLLRLAYKFKAKSISEVIFLQRRHHGVRGTAAAPISAKKVVDGWRQHDRIIMEKFDKYLQLADYLPRGSIVLPGTSDEAAALLQKFIVFARRDMWETASIALEDFFRAARECDKDQLTASESKRVGGVFCDASHGLHSAIQSKRFIKLMREAKPTSLRTAVKIALALSLPGALRAALRWRSVKNFKDSLLMLFLLRGGLKVMIALTDIAVSIMLSRLNGHADANFKLYADDPAFSD